MIGFYLYVNLGCVLLFEEIYRKFKLIMVYCVKSVIRMLCVLKFCFKKVCRFLINYVWFDYGVCKK